MGLLDRAEVDAEEDVSPGLDVDMPVVEGEPGLEDEQVPEDGPGLGDDPVVEGAPGPEDVLDAQEVPVLVVAALLVVVSPLPFPVGSLRESFGALTLD